MEIQPRTDYEPNQSISGNIVRPTHVSSIRDNTNYSSVKKGTKWFELTRIIRIELNTMKTQQAQKFVLPRQTNSFWNFYEVFDEMMFGNFSTNIGRLSNCRCHIVTWLIAGFSFRSKNTQRQPPICQPIYQPPVFLKKFQIFSLRNSFMRKTTVGELLQHVNRKRIRRIDSKKNP